MNLYKMTGLQIIWSLVFFLLTSCSGNKKDHTDIAIQWKDNRAEGLVIPYELLAGFTKDSVNQLLEVRLINSNTPILGESVVEDDMVIFQPLIAFTRGLKYELAWRGKLLKQIDIPVDEARKNPEVVSIYPSGDSLPVNLLKMYIVFSKPMQEGVALEHIIVIKDGRDTISSTFLNLEPELWNKERTVLTLWLDPGRIKRDLQPNKRLGSPLETGHHYEVWIKPGWMDTEGALLESSHHKNFLVVGRDHQSPDPDKWTIHQPKAGTRDPLMIELHESLDHVLLENTVWIADKKGIILNGVTRAGQEETVIRFTPTHPWISGDHTLEVEPRLEDLAGNNLERLFDKDLAADTTKTKKGLYKRKFMIR